MMMHAPMSLMCGLEDAMRWMYATRVLIHSRLSYAFAAGIGVHIHSSHNAYIQSRREIYHETTVIHSTQERTKYRNR